jgi:hypothetical protein
LPSVPDNSLNKFIGVIRRGILARCRDLKLFVAAFLVIGAFVLAFPNSAGHAQDQPKNLPPDSATSRNGTTCTGDTKEETQIADGLLWEHFCREAPVGGPWSIHVLQLARHRRDLLVQSAMGTDATGQFARVPLTELAGRETLKGTDVLAIINGDFDMAEPYFGVPVGLAITGGKIQSAGGDPRPVMSIFVSGRPSIGMPDVRMQAQVGKSHWPIATFNKPLGYAKSSGLRMYSRAFRTSVKAAKPFRAIVITALDRPLPPDAQTKIIGTISEIRNPATEQIIPENALLLAESADTKDSQSKLRKLSVGTRVTVRMLMRMNRQPDIREAIAGLPILVMNGQVAIVGELTGYIKQRHPRTAVCYNEQSTMFVVVDGRQPKLSVGMTLEELANLMVSLGCTEAMNTDGGGSTEMAVSVPQKNSPGTSKLEIVNSPSDGPERGRPNAWMIVRRH